MLVSYVHADSQQDGGYVDKLCVSTGDSLRFYISTAWSRFSINIYKCGQQKTLLKTYDHLKGGLQPVPENAYLYGCRWSQTFAVKITKEWTPGVYVAEFSVAKGNKQIVFCVQPEVPGSYSKICLKLTVNTWQAYNTFGGKSLYDNAADNVKASPKVSFARPFNDTYGTAPYFRWEDKLVSWLASHCIPFEVTTDVELYKNPNVLDPYKVLIIAGHDEYWSRPERDQVDQFVSRGGNLMILGGNTCWWQVRFEDDAKMLVCFKDQKLDPFTGVIDSLVTVNWYTSPINKPENSLTGLSYRTGGYVNASSIRPRFLGYGSYAVFGANEWVYNGTSLEDGGCFGYSSSIVGYEVDGASYRWINGVPVVTGIDKTPLNFKVLALSPSTGGDGSTKNHAVMGMYTRPGGGTVFNTGTTNWVDGLAADRSVQRITANVLSHFVSGKFPPSIVTWSPYRIQTDSILHERISYNKRTLSIPEGASQSFSLGATDPENKPLSFYWTVNRVIVSRDSSFSYQPSSGKPHSPVDTVVAHVYNQYDTSSIQWRITKSGLKIAPLSSTFDIESGSEFYQKLEVQHYFKDTLTFRLLEGPSWLTVNGEGEVSGTPTDTGKSIVRINVAADDGDQDSASFTICIHNFLVLDNFEYHDSPYNHGWIIATPTVEGAVGTEYDSTLQSMVLSVNSAPGSEFRIERDVNYSRSHFSARILATSSFTLLANCVDSSGIFLQVQYLPDEGASSCSGNYFFIRIGTGFRNGKWNLLERDCAADIGRIRRTSGIKVISYSMGGSFRLDDLAGYPYPFVSSYVEPLVKPTVFELTQNYPNPFNPATQLSYALPSSGIVRLQVFDILGRLVATLVADERQDAGVHSVRWEGVDSRGRDVSSGVYFERLDVKSSSDGGANVATRKMTLLR